MPATFPLTTNFEISDIVRDYMNWAIKDDPIMKLMPLIFQDKYKVVWEQPDNYYGLMPLRGINGTPDILLTPGAKRFAVDPGYYGSYDLIDEEKMDKERQLGTANDLRVFETLVNDAAQNQAVAFMNRVRLLICTLLTTGEFKIESRGGAKVHQYKVTDYNLVSAATAWSNTSSGKPISDLMTMRDTLNLGTSSDFGEGSKMYMSPVLITTILKTDQLMTTIKNSYGATPPGLPGLNQILKSWGLGEIVPYGESYSATAGAARSAHTRFLGSTKFIWVAKRPEDQPFGNFVMTKNSIIKPSESADVDHNVDPMLDNEDWKRGLYTLVSRVQPDVPPNYRVDVGFNGGPRINFPSAVAGITTS